MMNPDGSVLCHGYSGNKTSIDNPAAIALVDRGPIPCGPNNNPGMYTIGPWQANTYHGPLHHLGPNVAKLIPDDDQRDFIKSLGREPDTLYCHGGITGQVPTPTPGYPVPTGSEGCIVLPPIPRMQVIGEDV